MKNLFTKLLLICTVTFSMGFMSVGKVQAGAFVIVDGCSPDFWKDNTSKWLITGFLPGQPVRSVFTMPFYHKLGQKSLLQAMMFQTSNGDKNNRRFQLKQAEGVLIRVGAAALLNSAHPEVDFTLPTTLVINEVNAALASRNLDTILNLIGLLKELDDGLFPCPLE